DRRRRAARRRHRAESRRSEFDPARYNVAPHRPIAHEGIERVREGRGTVLLEEEVADPREEIAGDQPDEEPPGISRNRRAHDTREAEAGAGEVQPAARAIRVLREVERIEFRERRV